MRDAEIIQKLIKIVLAQQEQIKEIHRTLLLENIFVKTNSDFVIAERTCEELKKEI